MLERSGRLIVNHGIFPLAWPTPNCVRSYGTRPSRAQRGACPPGRGRRGRTARAVRASPRWEAAPLDGGRAERGGGRDLVRRARAQADRGGSGQRRYRQFGGDGLRAGDLIDVDAAGTDALALGYLGGAEVPAERLQRPAAWPRRRRNAASTPAGQRRGICHESSQTRVSPSPII